MANEWRVSASVQPRAHEIHAQPPPPPKPLRVNSTNQMRAASAGAFREGTVGMTERRQVSGNLSLQLQSPSLNPSSTPSTPVGNSSVQLFHSFGPAAPETPKGGSPTLRQDLFLGSSTQGGRLSLPVPPPLPAPSNSSASMAASSPPAGMMRAMSPLASPQDRLSSSRPHGFSVQSPSTSARVIGPTNDRQVSAEDNETGDLSFSRFSHKAKSQSLTQEPVRVTLNIYYQSAVEVDENGRRIKTAGGALIPEIINKSWKDIAGIFHVGVEVYDEEYCFGNYRAKGQQIGPEPSGIFSHPPKKAGPGNEFNQAEIMGTTKRSKGQVLDILRELSVEFSKASYNKYHHNCVDFARVFCSRLGVGAEIPSWCCRGVDMYRRVQAGLEMLIGSTNGSLTNGQIEVTNGDAPDSNTVANGIHPELDNSMEVDVPFEARVQRPPGHPTPKLPLTRSPVNGESRSRASWHGGPARARTLSPPPVSVPAIASTALPAGISTLGSEASPPRGSRDFYPGRRVFVKSNFKWDQTFIATILSQALDGTFTVHYDHQSVESGVSIIRIAPLPEVQRDDHAQVLQAASLPRHSSMAGLSSAWGQRPSLGQALNLTQQPGWHSSRTSTSNVPETHILSTPLARGRIVQSLSLVAEPPPPATRISAVGSRLSAGHSITAPSTAAPSTPVVAPRQSVLRSVPVEVVIPQGVRTYSAPTPASSSQTTVTVASTQAFVSWTNVTTVKSPQPQVAQRPIQAIQAPNLRDGHGLYPKSYQNSVYPAPSSASFYRPALATGGKDLSSTWR